MKVLLAGHGGAQNRDHEATACTAVAGMCCAIMLALGLAVLAYAVRGMWVYTVDDAFISLRYARNLAEGVGPTFNQDGPRAEGYTSFLWVLLLVLPHWLRTDAVAFAKGLGVACTVGAIAVAALLAGALVRRVCDAQRTFAQCTAGFVLCCAPAAAVHAISGMDTALFTLLLTSFGWLCWRYLNRVCKTSSLALGAVGVLVGITRPEGNLAVAVSLIALALVGGRTVRTLLVRYAVPAYAIPMVAYFRWRVAYYGLLFPLPFYVKAVHARQLAGLADVLGFAEWLALHLGVLLVTGLLTLDLRAIPLLAAAGSLAMFFVFPAHIMGYEHRFLFPLLPTLVAISAVGAALLVRALSGLRPARQSLVQTVAALAIPAAVGMGLVLGLPATMARKVSDGEGLRDCHVALGKFLAACPAGRWGPPRIAIGDAGAVPYYSKLETTDLVGLNEPYIAMSGDYGPEYVLAQAPDIVVIVSSDPAHLRPPAERYIWLYNACRRRGMRIANVARLQDGYHLWLMCWPNTAVWDYVYAWRQPSARSAPDARARIG